MVATAMQWRTLHTRNGLESFRPFAKSCIFTGPSDACSRDVSPAVQFQFSLSRPRSIPNAELCPGFADFHGRIASYGMGTAGISALACLSTLSVAVRAQSLRGKRGRLSRRVDRSLSSSRRDRYAAAVLFA